MEYVHVLQFIASRLESASIKYAVTGSACSAIQGCNIQPQDIDIMLSQPYEVEEITYIFRERIPNSPILVDSPMDEWISTTAAPVRTFNDPFNNQWTFARLIIENMKVEFANIAPEMNTDYTAGTGLWENGPHVWPWVRPLKIGQTTIPVIPLEVQLQTNMNRNLEDRVKEIINMLKTEGYDRELIHYALNKHHIEKFNRLIKE